MEKINLKGTWLGKYLNFLDNYILDCHVNNTCDLFKYLIKSHIVLMVVLFSITFVVGAIILLEINFLRVLFGFDLFLLKDTNNNVLFYIGSINICILSMFLYKKYGKLLQKYIDKRRSLAYYNKCTKEQSQVSKVIEAIRNKFCVEVHY